MPHHPDPTNSNSPPTPGQPKIKSTHLATYTIPSFTMKNKEAYFKKLTTMEYQQHTLTLTSTYISMTDYLTKTERLGMTEYIPWKWN